MRTQEQDVRGLRRTACTVNAAGAVTAGTGVIVTKNGTGTYTLRFDGYRALTSVNATTSAAAGFIDTSAPTGNVITLATFGTGGAAGDIGFNVQAVGIAK